MTNDLPDSLCAVAVPGQKLVVAYSGGLDSTVLLHWAITVARSIGFSIRAVHIDHGISSKSNEWVQACRARCAEWSVDFQSIRVHLDTCTGKGIECTARLARYQAFDGLEADWILLGHHADDQAETVLQNMLRGAGVRGVAAMLPLKGRYLRPFLHIHRKDLESYAHSRGLSWIDDDSNANLRYTRNYIRHALLPQIQKRFPAAKQRLVQAAEHMAEADQLLMQLAQLDAGNEELGFPIPLQRLRALSKTRAVNLLRYGLFSRQIQPPGERQVREFVRQIQEAGLDRHPELAFGSWILRCRCKQLHLVDRRVDPRGE